MPIDAIGALGAAQQTGAPAAVDRAAAATGPEGFGAALTGALEDLQALQGTSNELAIKAVTGDLTDIHQATLASTRAQVTLELVATIRNKGVDAFNEIMRMQA
ncbi:flagellar hook-basal body complex protein FliE [Occultella glacieicola]|uniref:Flagellar hook-basal body complex protein FliE n=1 Tax=Occultella glacieicola TaxID=2518684 RepID=A0ABY2E5E9_9MICO|nr:flagellar hook-basal body complex protein FliE [Occultella glacieicola]TDE94735.1 flagellar hook-basal body complex protein FliE [Occultella glacieicola]